jgi:hypothetical protein
MKKLIVLLALALAIVPLSLTTTGCVTGPDGRTSVDTNVIDKTAIVLRTTVTDLALIAVEKDRNAASYFQLANAVIDKLLDGGDLSPVTVRKALEAVPIKELQGTYAKVAIATALGSYEIYWGDYIRGKIGANYAAATLLRAVKDGITFAIPKASP